MYYLVPRLWDRKLYSESWASLHFWLATGGIVLYVVPLWVAGITQGLMWRELDAAGNLVIKVPRASRVEVRVSRTNPPAIAASKSDTQRTTTRATPRSP